MSFDSTTFQKKRAMTVPLADVAPRLLVLGLNGTNPKYEIYSGPVGSEDAGFKSTIAPMPKKSENMLVPGKLTVHPTTLPPGSFYLQRPQSTSHAHQHFTCSSG
mmetsp:Transcript_35165/g.104974  ORF Transcript_35165/g.104974 Transcript_35165/m.104974 type:complete len:104 (+) Transcript_35165:75-386(+)